MLMVGSGETAVLYYSAIIYIVDCDALDMIFMYTYRTFQISVFFHVVEIVYVTLHRRLV